MVIVEDEEERLVFGQVGYKVVDPLFELCPRNFHARPKVVMLSGSTQMSDGKSHVSTHSYAPHGNWEHKC